MENSVDSKRLADLEKSVDQLKRMLQLRLMGPNGLSTPQQTQVINPQPTLISWQLQVVDSNQQTAFIVDGDLSSLLPFITVTQQAATATGGAGVLPAAPIGFLRLTLNIDGVGTPTEVKIPYYGV